MTPIVRFSDELPLFRIARELHRRSHDGKTEAGAFLLGRLDGGVRVVEKAIYFDDVDPNALRRAAISFDTTKMTLVEDECERLGLRIVADIHTHPIEAFQSPIDRAHPVISVAEHVALVLPYDGRYRTLEQIGLFILRRDGSWHEVPDREKRFAIDTGKAVGKSTMSRTELLLLKAGLNGAQRTDRLLQTAVGIRASREACQSASGQAAILSTVALLTRFAHGGVRFEGQTDARLATDPGIRLGEEVVRLGARATGNEPRAWITIGDVPSGPVFSVALTASDGRFGCAASGTPGPFADTFVPGAIGAAALAVAEVFRVLVLGIVEVVPRTRSVSFFRSGEREVLEQTLNAPAEPVWIAGFGHLGNAYGWAMGMCPRFRPRLLVQDTQNVEYANASTQVFVTEADDGRTKTEVACQELRRLGFQVDIEPRRLDNAFAPSASSPATIMAGFDNPDARRALSRTGASLILDGGLGAGRDDFASFSLHRITDAAQALEIFREASAQSASTRPSSAAYDELAKQVDECGLVSIANTAVAVPFVGFFLAALVLTQLLRARSGLPMSDLVSGNVLDGIPVRAPIIERGSD